MKPQMTLKLYGHGSPYPTPASVKPTPGASPGYTKRQDPKTYT